MPRRQAGAAGWRSRRRSAPRKNATWLRRGRQLAGEASGKTPGPKKQRVSTFTPAREGAAQAGRRTESGDGHGHNGTGTGTNCAPGGAPSKLTRQATRCGRTARAWRRRARSRGAGTGTSSFDGDEGAVRLASAGRDETVNCRRVRPRGDPERGRKRGVAFGLRECARCTIRAPHKDPGAARGEGRYS